MSLWVVGKVKLSFLLVIKLTAAIDLTMLSYLISYDYEMKHGGGGEFEEAVNVAFFFTSTTKDLGLNSKWLK